MRYEVIYQLAGEQYGTHVAATAQTEKEALAFARNIENFPVNTVHYTIWREDGHLVWDTKANGLLNKKD